MHAGRVGEMEGMRRVSGNDTPKKETSPPPGFLDDSIVREARASISKMLGTAIDALGQDIQKVLQTNVASQSEIEKAVTQITTDMIKLLADRVRGLMPEAAAASPPQNEGGGGHDTTKPDPSRNSPPPAPQ